MLNSFKEYLYYQSKLLEFYHDCVKNRRIEVAVDPEDPKQLRFTFGGGPYAILLEQARERGTTTVSDLFITAHLLVHGPKVYRPTQEECFALEAIRPQVALEEYRQPFDTFVVEFPQTYSEARAVNGVRPLVVILHLMPGAFLLSSVIWSDGMATVNSLKPENAEETVEQVLARVHGRLWEDSLPVTEDERSFTEAAVRLGVNACMLLTHYGIRKLGYENPAHAARLEKYLAKAIKRKEGVEKARRELNALPVLYGFAKEFVLYDRATEAGTVGPVSPHWRAGHWRSQACGPAWTERKTVFIRPVFVNGHVLAARGH